MTDTRAVLDAFYGAVHSGDFVGLMAAISDDCVIEYYGPPTIPFAGIFRGKEKCQIFFGHVANDVVIQRFDQKEFIVDGDNAAVVGRLTLELKATGRIYDSPYVHVVNVKGGQVCRFRDFQNTALAAHVAADLSTPER